MLASGPWQSGKSLHRDPPALWVFKISPRKVSSALSVTVGIKITHLLSNNASLNLVIGCVILPSTMVLCPWSAFLKTSHEVLEEDNEKT